MVIMEFRFYPFDFEYKLNNGKPSVYLYGKTETGEKICVIEEHRPYFYAQIAGINLLELTQRLHGLTIENKDEPATVTGWEEVGKELVGKKERFLKIYTNYPKAVPLISKQLESQGVQCYEKDVLFVHRYLRDKNITPMSLVTVTGEISSDMNFRVPIVYAKSITPFSKESIQNPKILAVDIETYATSREINPEKNPILMIGFYGVDEKGQEYTKVLTWKKFNHALEYLEVVPDEAALLHRFREIVLEYQPDIITGYFSDVFDFPYLKQRAEKHRVLLDLGLDRSELWCERRGELREGKSWIRGIVHLDMFQFIRNIFGKNLKIDSLSLNAVSEELLGHKKQVVNLDRLGEVWDKSSDELADFCKYNLHDAHLTLLLCQKLLYDIIEFTKLIGLPPYDVIRMRFSRLVENYIMTRAMGYEVIAPNKPVHEEVEERMEESIEGAFVFEPIPGLYKDIVVFDFRSLYPTIITAHNIGPEGFQCGCCRDQSHVPGKEEYWFCQREKKFLPTVLEELIMRRADLKRLVKESRAKGEDTTLLESRSYALKILANSFYGYLGFFGARWYCLECAASTTAYARDYIKRTIQRARDRGFEVIYADTDSCFVLLGDLILDQAKEFMNEINFDLPGHMELEFEGYYPRGIFVAQKGSEKGAKKKYALISEHGKLKITGFETVRRNWSSIGKEIQERVLQLVLGDKTDQALQYVRDMVKELKKGAIPKQKVIIKTQITRDLSSYSSIGPHVAVAQRLAERGQRVVPGMLIEYIIVKSSGLIRDRAKIVSEVEEGEYDPEYYLNNQIIPAVSGIFAVLGYSEDQLFQESSQVGLGKFL